MHCKSVGTLKLIPGAIRTKTDLDSFNSTLANKVNVNQTCKLKITIRGLIITEKA
jgi:hypothetical protein